MLSSRIWMVEPRGVELLTFSLRTRLYQLSYTPRTNHLQPLAAISAKSNFACVPICVPKIFGRDSEGYAQTKDLLVKIPNVPYVYRHPVCLRGPRSGVRHIKMSTVITRG